MTRPDTRQSCLCYLEGSEVRTPLGDLAGVELRGTDGGMLGYVRGILVDAVRLRLRYLVVDATGSSGRSWLISPDALIHLEAQPLRLRVESGLLRPCGDPEAIRLAQTTRRPAMAVPA